MIQDLHSHTYYSFCGKDSPEAIVEAAIAGGIELFGICDHNYGIGYGDRIPFRDPSVPNAYAPGMLRNYFEHIDRIKAQYADRIRILRGIEIATNQFADNKGGKVTLPENEDISYFDYCLIEHLDSPTSVTGGDLFSFAKRCGCGQVGIAHTDLFAFIESRGEDPLDYFRRMAENNIFWELNVNYDSIHKYREHGYVKRFLEDEAQQRIVRESGVGLSVGFDGHRVEEYSPQRVKQCCLRLEELELRLVFAEEA